MKLLFKKASGFTLTEVLVCLVVVGFFIWLVSARWTTLRDSGTWGNGALSNARQLHLATQTMTLDTFSAGGNGMDWTMLASHGKTTPVPLAAYLRALVDNNYLTRRDLTKLLTAPGKKPVENDLSASQICFRFFQIDDESPADQPLLVSANSQPTGLIADAPYGRKGFVVFYKDGNGGIYKRPADATSPKVFPTGIKDGLPYRYVTLE